MVQPFEISTATSQGDLLGRDRRAARRLWEAHGVRVKTRALIQQHLPGLLADPPVTEGYAAALPNLLAGLETAFPEFHRYRVARNFLSKGIDHGNAAGLWRLDLPPVIVRISREPLLRSERWHRTAADTATWVAGIDDGLKNRNGEIDATEPAKILARLLLSAMTNGGLCDADAVSALVHRLGDERYIFAAGETVWLDLLHCAPGHLRNDVIEGKPVTLRRWFPDPISLGRLVRWATVPVERRHAIIADVDKNSIWTMIRRICPADALPSSLGGFARVAIHLAELHPDVDLPQALVEVAIGRTRTVSLPGWNWALLMRTDQTYATPKLTFDSATSSGKGAKARRDAPNGALILERDLRKALAEPQATGRKLTPAVALERLQALDPPSSISAALVDWYRELLTVERLKVSSVRRYHAAVGRAWLALAEGREIGDFEPGDLDDLYHRAIELRMSPEARAYDAGRWRQLHEFIVRRYGAPPLSAPLDGDEDAARTVRAVFIPLGVHMAARRAMRACDALDRLSRLGLETLMVLAHRSGMRLGELLKLRLMDIEPSVERWAFIRPNRHGDNKSGSARRKVPLAALLTQNEGVLLERYMSLRAGQADGPAELLFHVPGAPHTPWDPWRVSGMVAGLLRRASGSDAFVFHHYRHTALSLMHLVLEGADDWANRLGGVSAEHAARIRLAVTGRDKPGRDRYWALARLAGHSSPETTFGSYLHFCDLLIGERLTRGAQALPANAWRQITGFTANKLTRVVNAGDVADKSVNTEIPAGVLRPAILGALGGAMVAIGSDVPVDVSELALPKIVADMADIALRALARLERGMPITTVAYEFGVDEEQLVRWRDNARAIAARTTRRGGCRHIARERSLRQRTEILLPGRPRSHAEKAEASALIQNLRTMYKSRRDDLIWAIRYVLSNSDSSDSGVRFEQADDLGRFLALFDGLFPTSRWSATCRLPLVEAAPSTGLWRGVLGNIGFAENRDRRHHGRRQLITLRLTHPNEARVLHRHRGTPKGYAATTLRYVFHVLGIMLGGGDAN